MDPISVQYADAWTYARDATDFFNGLVESRDSGWLEGIGKAPRNFVDVAKPRDASTRSTLLAFGPRLRNLARVYLSAPTDANYQAYQDAAAQFQSEAQKVIETGTGSSASIGARRYFKTSKQMPRRGGSVILSEANKAEMAAKYKEALRRSDADLPAVIREIGNELKSRNHSLGQPLLDMADSDTPGFDATMAKALLDGFFGKYLRAAPDTTRRATGARRKGKKRGTRRR